ncbi:MAG TPA: universal stress protein [Blastocatellia bacterium]|nr:universal stress protein [Blastocatellia bacterium]
MKILLPVDGSDCSNAAVNEVAKRPWPAGSEVRILSAVELPFVPTTETWALPDSYYSQLEEAGREQAHKAIDAAVEKLRDTASSREIPLEITTHIVDGSARDAILSEAEKWGADLIVLGSHGRRGLQRFLLGSVSNAIATHAPCSVEIVRCRQTA